jgi:hypothetical protein
MPNFDAELSGAPSRSSYSGPGVRIEGSGFGAEVATPALNVDADAFLRGRAAELSNDSDRLGDDSADFPRPGLQQFRQSAVKSLDLRVKIGDPFLQSDNLLRQRQQ